MRWALAFFFNGGLSVPEAADFDLWFKRRPIGEIIGSLRRFGDVWTATFLENWKKGPGGKREEATQAVLKEHCLADFKKMTDLLNSSQVRTPQ